MGQTGSSDIPEGRLSSEVRHRLYTRVAFKALVLKLVDGVFIKGVLQLCCCRQLSFAHDVWNTPRRMADAMASMSGAGMRSSSRWGTRVRMVA